LRLPCQNQRQQLLGGRLDVRQQPHLFEQLVAQALRLVDDQRGHFLACPARAQLLFERVEQRRLRRRGPGPEPEPRGEYLDELLAPQRRIVEDDRLHALAALRFERRAQQRRLSGPRFADQDGDRLR